MSEKEIIETEDGQMLTAEYRDGQLQIVEVTPFDKNNDTHILPDAIGDDSQTKYLQVLDSSGKGLVHLDLLNFTLVKCPDGDDATYQMVGASSDDGETLTCVLSNDDNDESESRDGQSYVYLESVEQNSEPQEKLIESATKRQLTPTEILEKAKALQKAKAILTTEHAQRSSTRGRKRKGSLPPPLELLSSPNFKLFLYSCKMCSFKCNAVKEMSAHKASEHGSGSRGAGARNATLQCARCPYKATVHSQLMKHVHEVHFPESEELDSADSKGQSDTDCDGVAEVLVCGACGFESDDRTVFTDHIQAEHRLNVVLPDNILSIQDNSDADNSIKSVINYK